MNEFYGGKNMNELSRIFRTCVIGVMFALIFALPAGAGLIVNFPSNLELGQVQYYWATEGTNPALGRTPSAYGTPLSEITSVFARAFDTTPSARYEFWAGSSLPNSGTDNIRIWSDKDKPTNSLYTDTKPFSNNLGSGGEDIFGAITYVWIKAAPGAAKITKYSDSGTTYINPVLPVSRTVTFYSDCATVSGYAVQIKETTWSISKNGEAATFKNTGTSKDLVLSTLTGSDLSAGTSYTIMAKHKNYWDAENAYSAPVTYTIGSGPGGAAITVNLKRKLGGPGINSFSVPGSSFSISAPAKDGVALTTTLTTTTIGNAFQLCKVINEINGGPLVRTFGYWDADQQKAAGVMITYTAGYISSASEAELTGINLSNASGYQVYLKPDGDLATTITFTMQ